MKKRKKDNTYGFQMKITEWIIKIRSTKVQDTEIINIEDKEMGMDMKTSTGTIKNKEMDMDMDMEISTGTIKDKEMDMDMEANTGTIKDGDGNEIK